MGLAATQGHFAHTEGWAASAYSDTQVRISPAAAVKASRTEPWTAQDSCAP